MELKDDHSGAKVGKSYILQTAPVYSFKTPSKIFITILFMFLFNFYNNPLSSQGR